MAECLDYPLVVDELQIQENPFGPCSGQGECQVDRTCICEAPWSGRSDFVNYDTLDCQVNLTAVRLLWLANLLFGLWAVWSVWPRVLYKWEQHKTVQARKLGIGKSYTIFDNRGFMCVVSFLVVAFPAQVAFGLMMIIEPEQQRIGIDGAATVLFAVAKIGFYVAIWYFQPALLMTVLSGQKDARQLVLFSDTLGFWNMILSSSLSILPFVTLFGSEDGTDDSATIVYLLYFGGSAINMLGFAGQSIWIKLKISAVLSKSYELTQSENVLEVKGRMIKMQDSVAKSVFLQGMVCVIFLFLPFFSGAHVYFLPLSWFALPVLFRQMATSTVSTKSLKESSWTQRSEGTKLSSTLEIATQAKMASSAKSSRQDGTLRSVTGAPSFRERARSDSLDV
mmetsp:Transcript_9964/g.17455  ORF Transcript_9964/g.17455 Transcript_9964/m.17455 type:complete len:394 (+) Transcript_9964:304-1485(+)